MASSLKEILLFRAGTLIKGLTIDLTGAAGLSINGWSFEQKKVVKDLWMPADRDIFVFSYYKNKYIEEHLRNNKIIPSTITNLEFGILQKNGGVFFTDIQSFSKQEVINEGSCLGMSLGESFLAIHPTTHYGIYRPDFYEVFLLHKILFGEEIRWVVLHSKHVGKQLILTESNPKLLDVLVELL